MRVDLPNTAIHLTGHDGARHSRNPFRIRGLSRKIHHLVGDDMGAPPNDGAVQKREPASESKGVNLSDCLLQQRDVLQVTVRSM